MSQTFIERRMHERESLRLPVEISHDGKFARGEILNLSSSGAQIAGILAFEPGNYLGVEFEAPRVSQIFERAANVVWSHNNQMGIRFIPSTQITESSS